MPPGPVFPRRRRPPHAFPAKALGLALLAVLAGSAATAAVQTEQRGAAPGDWARFHVTVRDEAGRVLQTTDAELARQEAAAGNPDVPDPDLVHPRVYRALEGFLGLEGDGLQPATYLVGRLPGDVVRTPLLTRPLPPRPAVPFPRHVVDVALEFQVEAGLLEPAAGPRPARYAGIPVEVLGTGEGGVQVRAQLGPGDVVRSPRQGFALEVTGIQGDTATLAPRLREGDVFTTLPCAFHVGLTPGRYRVERETAEHFLLAPDSTRDAMARGAVSLDLELLELNRWPDLLRARLLLEQATSPGNASTHDRSQR